MKKVDLSIIILSYNTKKLLQDCLKSVFKGVSYSQMKNEKCQMKKLEVIVVDNNSTDGSGEYLKRFFSGAGRSELKVIFSNKNLGFAGGNNLGLKKARGKYILFLNSDTQVKPQAFVKTLAFMEKNPKVGALTPKTILFSGGMDPDCHRGFPTPWASITYFLGLEKLFPRSKFFGQYHKMYFNLDESHEIDAGFGTFLLTRKSVLDQIGGWDEEYFFYGEDLDFFYRVKQAGWQVIFYPKALVTHYKGASSGLRKESEKAGVAKANQKTRVKTAKASIKAMEIFYRKFYQDKYPKWLTFLVIFGIKAKGVFRVWRHKLR